MLRQLSCQNVRVTMAVDGQNHGDEIGGMDKAVQVFKDNTAERVRLKAPQAIERTAKEQRPAAVEGMSGRSTKRFQASPAMWRRPG